MTSVSSQIQVESKLIPILREGIEIIKMIFFKKLQDYLTKKYPDQEPGYINKLAGTMINDFFGTPNTQEPFACFAQENNKMVQEELSKIPSTLKDMRIPLTDALRIQVLCDHQEGIDNSSVLEHAQKMGILLIDRELPLPHSFMNLVRKLGSAFGIIIPPVPEENT